ncbi:MAG: prolipoprotein diacylglyceryl transferase family protein, partial [Stellaceae bacterium]
GRQTNVWWAMIFPSDPLHVPRYPSELIEATLEGIVLFLALYFLQRNNWVRRQRGMLTGAFCIGYAIARIVSETFREPDIAIVACNQASTPCFLFGGLTMGQLLSIPVLLAGLFLVWYAWPKRQRA